jgi:hypothetical protein
MDFPVKVKVLLPAYFTLFFTKQAIPISVKSVE